MCLVVRMNHEAILPLPIATVGNGWDMAVLIAPVWGQGWWDQAPHAR